MLCMMKRLLVYILLLILFACEKDEVGHLNCINFKEAIVNEDETMIRSEIENLTSDLYPVPTPEDNIGHMLNLHTLVDRIYSDCNDINATIICYACINTYPPGSEISIAFEYENTQIEKTIDIFTSGDDLLHYAGIHETQ